LELPVVAVENPEVDQRYDLVLVVIRAEQLEATLPTLTNMHDGSDVLFLGNLAGHGPTLIQALGGRTVFGFPAAGGTRDGSVIRYVLIPQQKTTLGEPNGETSSRIRRLQILFSSAGFPIAITANVEGWLLGHAAFVVPMAFALYRVDTDAGRLARDLETLRLMVRATRQASSGVAGLRDRGDPDQPHRPVPMDAPAIRSPILATSLGQPPRRTVVCRPQPHCRPRDDRPHRPTRSCGAPIRARSPDLHKLLSPR
jgi:2-dehydropantoate 2-reductase